MRVQCKCVHVVQRCACVLAHVRSCSADLRLQCRYAQVRVNQSCPRVGWTRGSGRVGSGRVGSGQVGSRFCRILAGRVQHLGFLVVD